METAIKSNDVTDEIRPLTDIELDAVDGGGAMLLGAAVLLACAIGVVLGKCSK